MRCAVGSRPESLYEVSWIGYGPKMLCKLAAAAASSRPPVMERQSWRQSSLVRPPPRRGRDTFF